MNEFEINAEPRADVGKGASRRLRRSGMVPVVLYGGEGAPVNLATSHNALLRHLEHEAFYSHVLTLRVSDSAESVVLKDLQRHPAKPYILHMDLQRVTAGRKLHMHVPLHFINEDTAPGKKAGGAVFHLMNEVEISCLPKDLPEFIEVDLAAVELGQSVHLSELRLPEGVELAHPITSDTDQPVVTIHKGGIGGLEETAPGTETT